MLNCSVLWRIAVTWNGNPKREKCSKIHFLLLSLQHKIAVSPFLASELPTFCVLDRAENVAPKLFPLWDILMGHFTPAWRLSPLSHCPPFIVSCARDTKEVSSRAVLMLSHKALISLYFIHIFYRYRVSPYVIPASGLPQPADYLADVEGQPGSLHRRGTPEPARGIRFRW